MLLLVAPASACSNMKHRVHRKRASITRNVPIADNYMFFFRVLHHEVLFWSHKLFCLLCFIAHQQYPVS
jgi:hypothetical protein